MYWKEFHLAANSISRASTQIYYFKFPSAFCECRTSPSLAQPLTSENNKKHTSWTWARKAGQTNERHQDQLGLGSGADGQVSLGLPKILTLEATSSSALLGRQAGRKTGRNSDSYILPSTNWLLAMEESRKPALGQGKSRKEARELATPPLPGLESGEWMQSSAEQLRDFLRIRTKVAKLS